MTRTGSGTQSTIERPGWLSHDVWPYEVRTAYLGESTVAYTDEGVGPVLLLVHDGMCSYLWVHLIGLLRERFRIATLDFPGSGLSPANGEPVGLEADSWLLECFIDYLDLDEVTLIAHDLGGGVGLGFATRRPDVVAGMTLINTFAWPPRATSLRGMLRLVGAGLWRR